MEENKLNKSNKLKIFVLTMLILLVSIAGITYAYFTIQITGNDTASSMRLTSANISLVYNDVQMVAGEYIQPGWSQTKTLTVTNNGNVDAEYTIIWRDLINEMTNNELVIYATCASSVQGNTCDDIPETAVPLATTEVHNQLAAFASTIAPGETHTYTLTMEFKETGSNQNYNQNKYFNGTLNIADANDFITPERYFSYNTCDYNISLDLDVNTCKSKVMTACTGNQEPYYNLCGFTAQQATDFCTTSGSDLSGIKYCFNNPCNDIWGNEWYISQNEYASYGISNLVRSGGKIKIYNYNTSGGTDVVIPSHIDGKSVSIIGYGAFRSKGLTSVYIPNTVTGIQGYAFEDNSLSQVTIPTSAIGDAWLGFGIGDSAFANNQLTSVTIPDGITTILNYTFYNNRLTSVTIPSSVNYIYGGAFANNQLTSVTISGTPEYLNIDGDAFCGNSSLDTSELENDYGYYPMCGEGY